jgi:sugar fermentation stimulation protein A
VTYLLLIYLKRRYFLKIGKRGIKEFRGGYYVYVGSGRRYGFQRIMRHIKKLKKLKWHVDYILKKGEIKRIWIILGESTNECIISKALQARGKIVVKKFGSSDCHCPSHLFYFKNNPERSIEKIINLLIT